MNFSRGWCRDVTLSATLSNRIVTSKQRPCQNAVFYSRSSIATFVPDENNLARMRLESQNEIFSAHPLSNY